MPDVIVMGIDPGFQGSIAVVQSDLSWFYDMPSVSVKHGTGKRSLYDAAAIASIIKIRHPAAVVVEDVGAQPKGKLAVASLSKCVGIVEGICATLQIPLYRISPQEWKKVMLPGVQHKADKQAVLLEAKRRYPRTVFSKPDDAEALFMAEYGRGIINGQQSATVQSSTGSNTKSLRAQPLNKRMDAEP